MTGKTYCNGYHWWLDNRTTSTFIALHEDGLWYLPGIGNPVRMIEDRASYRGLVSRRVSGGGSIDQ
jgi:hypothetical protein